MRACRHGVPPDRCPVCVSENDTSDEQWYLRRSLKLMNNAIFPGRGKQHAMFVHEVCKSQGWNEDEYLPGFVIRNKKEWGL